MRRQFPGWSSVQLAITMALSLTLGAAALESQAANQVEAGSTDYLSSDLRQRVEQLKADVERTATVASNIRERALTLWDWGNAFALDGRYVPVNLTTVLARAGGRSTPTIAGRVDAFVRELTLLDEEADAIGALTATLGPFQVRSMATVQQTYTVGSRAIEAGGGLAITRHFMADYGPLQTTDPSGDHYLSIASSNRGVRFEAITVPFSGMHGGFRGALPVPFFQVAQGRLVPGDTVTVTYGGRSGGGGGLLMPTLSTDRMPFPLYLRLDATGDLLSLPIQPIRLVGGALHGVRGFGPSVLRPGESFDLSIRARDQFFNRATGPSPEWRVEANGVAIGEVPAGDEAIQLLRNIRFNDEGVQRITIRSADGVIVGEANPILVSSAAQRVFWGDTHGHSGFAEGIGTPDRFMTWAKDDARLDFVTHSEHDIWTDDFEWEVLRNNVAKYSEDGRFVAFLGYEWTTRNLSGGHHNVLFRTPQGRDRVATQFYPTLSELYFGLRKNHDPKDVVVIPHAHQAGNYRLGDPKLQPLVEIMSQHGTFEWFGRMYLSHGQQVGFTAASDNHLSQPGYTAPKGAGLSQRGGLGAVLADEVTADALFDAMKQLKAYATTGERIILDVDLNGTGMGQRAEFSESRRIKGRVVGTAPISTVTVVKNGEVFWHKDYLTRESESFGSEDVVVVSFASQSVPMHRGDNPRGWRPWRGTLEVTGARLLSADPTDFFNFDVQTMKVDSENPNKIEFSTNTRGDLSSIRMTLAGASAATRVQLSLDEATEFGGAPPLYRPLATLPASTVVLSLGEMERGVVSKALPFDVYEDTVTLRHQIRKGDLDVSFSVTDTSRIQGDYYYVRVTQADDSSAWSSPIWVGGYGSR